MGWGGVWGRCGYTAGRTASCIAALSSSVIIALARSTQSALDICWSEKPTLGRAVCRGVVGREPCGVRSGVRTCGICGRERGPLLLFHL